MKIVFISTMPGYPWGGSEELWSQAALQLRSQGHDVAASVVWWPRLSPKVTALAERGIELFIQPSAQASLPVRAWRKIVRRMGGNRSEFKWFRRQKPDLVVISQGAYKDGRSVAAEAYKLGMPYCLISQAVPESAWPSDKQREEVRHAYIKAAASFFVSEENLKDVTRFCGFDLPNAEVVRNPFNLSYDARPPWPKDDSVLKLACVARLEPSAKGQDILIQVLASEKWRKRAITVDLYGSGPAQEGLQGLARYLKVENVRLKGHAADICKLWSEHEALILPSRFEGLPLALVEAMLCGRPAIVTDVAGNKEVLEDGVTGFVAAAPTVELLDEALERAWHHRAKLHEMGERAAKRIRELVPHNPSRDFAEKLLKLVKL